MIFRALLTLKGGPANTISSIYHWFKSRLVSELAAAIALITLCKTRQNKNGPSGFRCQYTQWLGTMKWDGHHNNSLPKGVSMGNGGHVLYEIPRS